MDKYTLPVGIALFQTSYYAQYGLTPAASVLCTLLVLVAFLRFQRHIIQGIALTGLKDWIHITAPNLIEYPSLATRPSDVNGLGLTRAQANTKAQRQRPLSGR